LKRGLSANTFSHGALAMKTWRLSSRAIFGARSIVVRDKAQVRQIS
jgi:hypothetical protein